MELVPGLTWCVTDPVPGATSPRPAGPQGHPPCMDPGGTAPACDMSDDDMMAVDGEHDTGLGPRDQVAGGACGVHVADLMKEVAWKVGHAAVSSRASMASVQQLSGSLHALRTSSAGTGGAQWLWVAAG